MKMFKSFAFGLLVTSALGLAPVSLSFAETKTGTETKEEQTKPADILGFRSAHFGMSLEQVSMAIEKDFGLKGDKIQIGHNMVTKTDSLSITVENLLPDTGKAFVSYIFGYESKGLIQANIVWNSAEDPKQNAETILGIAGSLQKYFLDQNFEPSKVAAGVQMNEDTIMLLRAADKDGQAVVLMLEGVKPPENPDTAKEMLLHLSYQANPEKPDIYRIPEGKF